MERIINIAFISENRSLFVDFKSKLRRKNINLIYVASIEESWKLVTDRIICVAFLDATYADINRAVILRILEASRNKGIFFILIGNYLSDLLSLSTSIRECVCDAIELPFDYETVNNKVENYKKIYSRERKVSLLLQDVFPPKVVEEFYIGGFIKPKRFNNAVILFTDFVNFSKKSANMEPIRLVQRLDEYFTRFDDICDRYKLEKIKTIGDAYMAIAGVLEGMPAPEIRTCLAANEIINFIKTENQLDKARGIEEWQIRVGINSGKLVGGIIGRKKYAYDVWGDSVNIAARAQQAADPNTVLISESVFAKVKKYFKITEYGEMEIKKRGGTVNMYLLGALMGEYCSDELGVYPNIDLMRKCNLLPIDFFRMRQNIIHTLKCYLANDLYYHTIDRTLKVERIAKRYAQIEGIEERDIILLRTAALYHDVGFIFEYKDNEHYSALLARNTLPVYGYTESDIKQIESLINVTSYKASPKNYLEGLIRDANSDYLGRADYNVIASKLRNELSIYGKLNMTELQWIDFQLNFLEFTHRYYTNLVKNLRDKGKTERIEKLKAKRTEIIKVNLS